VDFHQGQVSSMQWGGFRSAPLFTKIKPFDSICHVSGYCQLTNDNDRRSGNDRRGQAGLNIRILLGNGQRRIIRRMEDQTRYFFVDQYNPRFFLSILAITLLSVIDGFLTLSLINHGAYETNPFMAFCLKAGPIAFIAVKYALTSFGVLILFIFRNIVLRKIKVRVHSLLFCAVWVFVAVVVWEFYLIYYVVI
jgi:hypothetical protein